MRVFDERNSAFADKVNFVDENNVLLGYDLSQDCCEYASWFIADEITEDLIDNPNELPDLSGWSFDPSFFKKLQFDALDNGEMVVFRIVNGDQEKFIHLFNSQNGYYCHGFTFQRHDEIIQEGYL